MSVFLGDDGVDGIFLGDTNTLNTAILIEGEPLAGEVKILPYSGCGESKRLLVGNSQEVRLNNLVGANSGALILGAAVSVTIRYVSGGQLPGVEWPILMESSSENNYWGFLPHDLPIVDDRTYVVEVNASAGESSHAQWEADILAVDRGLDVEGCVSA